MGWPSGLFGFDSGKKKDIIERTCESKESLQFSLLVLPHYNRFAFALLISFLIL